MSFVLEMGLRSSLVLAAGLAVLWALRNQPAALRHWVLAATLSLSAVQPAMNQVIPAWKVARYNWPPSVVENVAAVRTDVEFDLPAGHDGLVYGRVSSVADRSDRQSRGAADWRRLAHVADLARRRRRRALAGDGRCSATPVGY